MLPEGACSHLSSKRKGLHASLTGRVYTEKPKLLTECDVRTQGGQLPFLKTQWHSWRLPGSAVLTWCADGGFFQQIEKLKGKILKKKKETRIRNYKSQTQILWQLSLLGVTTHAEDGKTTVSESPQNASICLIPRESWHDSFPTWRPKGGFEGKILDKAGSLQKNEDSFNSSLWHNFINAPWCDCKTRPSLFGNIRHSSLVEHTGCMQAGQCWAISFLSLISAA